MMLLVKALLGRRHQPWRYLSLAAAGFAAIPPVRFALNTYIHRLAYNFSFVVTGFWPMDVMVSLGIVHFLRPTLAGWIVLLGSFTTFGLANAYGVYIAEFNNPWLSEHGGLTQQELWYVAMVVAICLATSTALLAHYPKLFADQNYEGVQRKALRGAEDS